MKGCMFKINVHVFFYACVKEVGREERRVENKLLVCSIDQFPSWQKQEDTHRVCIYTEGRVVPQGFKCVYEAPFAYRIGLCKKPRAGILPSTTNTKKKK